MKTLFFVAWLAAGTADATTSHVALARHLGQEANPLMGSTPWVNSGLQAGYLAGSLYAYRRWSSTHPKLAAVAAIGITSAHVAATVHNMGVLRGRR